MTEEVLCCGVYQGPGRKLIEWGGEGLSGYKHQLYRCEGWRSSEAIWKPGVYGGHQSPQRLGGCYWRVLRQVDWWKEPNWQASGSARVLPATVYDMEHDWSRHLMSVYHPLIHGHRHTWEHTTYTCEHAQTYAHHTHADMSTHNTHVWTCINTHAYADMGIQCTCEHTNTCISHICRHEYTQHTCEHA